jgi:hemolysin III
LRERRFRREQAARRPTASAGWWLFGAVCGLALVGIVIDTLRAKGGGSLSLVIYLAMGWLILFALDPIIAVLPRWASDC